MKSKFAMILLILLCTGTASAQSVYRWVDAKGTRHYSDKPPARSNLAPIKVKVAQPSLSPLSPSVAAVETKPVSPTDAQKAAEQQLKIQRSNDCDVARNNVRLLNDPKTQVVEKGQEGKSVPMDNLARIEAMALAERQVQDLCR